MKNTKCVLFDVDGVVVNSEMFSVQYGKKYGISNDEMLPFFTGVFQKCVTGKADLKEVLKEWLPKWKWKGITDEFLQAWFEAEHNIDEQIIKVVEQLRADEIKCYLATNQEKHRAQYISEKMGFAEIFDGLFLSLNIGHKKPEKEFYEYILENLENHHNIKPNEIMFFDDDQKNINGARAVGIDSYLYTNFEEFNKIINKVLN